MNYLKDSIFESFFKEYNRLLFVKKIFFSQHIVTESSRLEEEIIIKDVRNLFRLKRELNYAAINDVRNLHRLEKETEVVTDKIFIRDIKNICQREEEEKNYYKPVRIRNFWRNNCIEFESNDDRNKALSVEEYLNKIKQYLKDIINNLKSLTRGKFT